ncbi:hypothetical protein CH365_04475 [Leptospira neocaledonica]|uniref:Uncharacterized protein n=1 Tax=Leptospira neocaledonica TaxID=2023192 RepID=A0A2N0A2M4_9LEPT|nr:hypothetical protein CH365_04475 [Leptospira neocaledonica]
MQRTGFFLDLGDFRPILELVHCGKPATRKGNRKEKQVCLSGELLLWACPESVDYEQNQE